MEKDFFDVFPHLKVKKELEELLDMVFVTKVSMNPGRTHLRVYIESSRWIHKKNIFALEDEIERQCFPGIPMTVTVVENFIFPSSTHRRISWKATVPVWSWSCAATICWSTICSEERRSHLPEKMPCVWNFRIR